MVRCCHWPFGNNEFFFAGVHEIREIRGSKKTPRISQILRTRTKTTRSKKDWDCDPTSRGLCDFHHQMEDILPVFPRFLLRTRTH
jgi:hypothetical protein